MICLRTTEDGPPLGVGFQLSVWDKKLRPRELHDAARKAEAANMADTGPHWLEDWMLPLTLGVHGSLGEDF